MGSLHNNLIFLDLGKQEPNADTLPKQRQLAAITLYKYIAFLSFYFIIFLKYKE